MEKELWKDVVGFEQYYEVSNLGNVRSKGFEHKKYRNSNSYYIVKGKLLKPDISTWGYLRVSLARPKKKIGFIHRLVALAFIPNPNNLPQVNHINGIKTDNRVENLEWVSAKQNTQHAVRIGLYQKMQKPIIQLKNGIVIKEYQSIRQASRDTNIDVCNIRGVLKGRQKQAKGYQFVYKELYIPTNTTGTYKSVQNDVLANVNMKIQVK